MSLNKSETWKWKNWEISWSLSKEYSSEKNIQIPPDDHFVNMFHHFYNLIFTKKGIEKEYKQNILQGKLIQEMMDCADAK